MAGMTSGEAVCLAETQKKWKSLPHGFKAVSKYGEKAPGTPRMFFVNKNEGGCGA